MSVVKLNWPDSGLSMCSSNVKTIVIKNFRGLPTVPENYAETEWTKLQTAIRKIQRFETPDTNYENLYRIVENLCIQHHKAYLLENLYGMIEDYLAIRLEHLHSLAANEFLQQVATEWQGFNEQIKIIKNVFLHLDRTMHSNKYNSIACLSMNLFRTVIIANPLLSNRLVEGILGEIKCQRIGEQIDDKLVQTLVVVLEELQVFDEVFKVRFLETSKEFYCAEGKSLVANFCVYDYIAHVNRRILEEESRTAGYLNAATGKEVMNILCDSLIKKHMLFVLENGLNLLLDKNDLKELALLFELMRFASNGLKCLVDSFTAYLIKQGSLMVTNPENDKKMIQQLLDFKSRIDAIVQGAFRSNAKFLETVRHSFAQFINKRQNKPAELLAKYVDSKMRCNSLAETEMEQLLRKIMVLFRLVQGKDVFEAFYKKDLAKRLLLGKSSSQDVEKNMLSKLKEECGSNYTAKLEGMFKDMNISSGITTAFRQHLCHLQSCEGNQLSNTVDLYINVLTSSYWPNYSVFSVNLPSELLTFQQAFQKFYSANHSGRKLQWQPDLGHCLMKARFGHTNKELQVSLFQTLVLLLFNDVDKLTYSEIKELTNMDTIELQRTLLSLACGKSRVVTKNPKGIDIKDTDVFSFNDQFNDKLFRIKINQVQLKESAEEQRATQESVLQDRQFQVDAAIVRIMKRHKVLHHNVLMSQLYNVLDIPIDPANLKKRIEQLIEREYVERDKDNPARYKYVA